MKLFPILNSNIFRAIPWGVIGHGEEQSQLNHSQSLGLLAERGGLTSTEAVAIIEGRKYHNKWPNAYTSIIGMQADIQLLDLVIKWKGGQ